MKKKNKTKQNKKKKVFLYKMHNNCAGTQHVLSTNTGMMS